MVVYSSGKDSSGKKERSSIIEKADVKKEPEEKKVNKEKKQKEKKQKEKNKENIKAPNYSRSQKLDKLDKIKEKIKLRISEKKRETTKVSGFSISTKAFSPFKKIDNAKFDSFFSNILTRILISILLAAAGIFFLTLSFAPYGFWPLVFFALVPLLVAAHRIAPRRMAGIIMALGIGGFFKIYFNGFFGEDAFFLANYLYLFVALFFFISASLQRAFHSRSNYRWFIIEGAIFWTGFEMLRGFIPGLGTTGFLATALYKQFWFIQPVSMLSIYGLSLLIVFINHIITFFVISYMDSRLILNKDSEPVSKGAAKRWLFLAVAILLGWFGFSLSLLQSPLPAVRVAVVQPGHYIHETVFGGEMRKMFRKSIQFQEDFDELLSISKRATRDNARLLVWNEATLPFNPHFRGTEQLQNFVKQAGTYLVVGYRATDDGAEGVTILSPDGVFLGKSYQTLIGSIGTAVSDDIDNTWNFRRISTEGTRIVALSTFHSSKQGPRRLPNVVFRAVENHLSIVKADGHHASAIIDPYGRLIQYSSSESSTRRVLVGDIPAGSGNTLVVMWGDWLGWLSFGGMCFFLLIMAISHLRGKIQADV